MARFNEILVGRYNRYLQKLLAVKGGPTVPQIASEFMGVLLTPSKGGRENHFLLSEDLFYTSQIATGVALQNAGIQLRNPAGTNAIVIVENLVVNPQAATDLVLTWSAVPQVALTTLSAGFRMDNRQSRSASALEVSFSSNVAAGFPIELLRWSFTAASNGGFELMNHDFSHFVIPPGVTLLFRNSTVAVTLYLNARFRERFLEDSERS